MEKENALVGRLRIAMNKTSDWTQRVCYSCRHFGARAGDCHIYCKAVFKPDDNPLQEVLAVLGGVGRTPFPSATEGRTFQPKKTSWPGCGSWPSNYDPNIIQDCPNHAVKEDADA